MRINTERLSIRPYASSDADALIELLFDEKVKKTFIVPDFESREQYEKMFNKMKEYSESDKHYSGGIYLNNILIGLILDTEIINSTVEMGYAIHPSYHNCGYATEALRGAIAYLFQNGIDEVIAGAFSDNTASIKVMEKNGMRKTEKQEDIEYRGKTRRCLYYSVKKAKI